MGLFCPFPFTAGRVWYVPLKLLTLGHSIDKIRKSADWCGAERLANIIYRVRKYIISYIYLSFYFDFIFLIFSIFRFKNLYC